MGLLDFLRGNRRPPDQALEAYLAEVARLDQGHITAVSDPAHFASGRAILEQPPAAQAATLVAAWAQVERVLQSNEWDYQILWGLRSLMGALQRKRLPLSLE